MALLGCASQNPSFVALHWQPLREGAPSGYRVHYRAVNTASESFRRTRDASYTFHDLEPGVDYAFIVRAEIVAGGQASSATREARPIPGEMIGLDMGKLGEDVEASRRGSEGEPVVGDIQRNSVTLEWDPPVRNVDGTPLEDLAGYRVYYGPTLATEKGPVWSVDPRVTIKDLPVGETYYFAVSAVNVRGKESDRSAPIKNTVSLPVKD